VAALESLDVEAAPALILAGAAEFAGHLQLDERRAELIEAALAKDEGFEKRMALGMHLMTRLEEVEKGEQIFKEAFAAAKDDEQRATVRWYEAAALREREDLHGDEYEKALQALAEEFGDTYFGSVAADRLRSRAFEVGDEAVPLALRTVGGETLRLADLKGKVVALHFWASWCGPCEQAAPHLAALHEKYGEHGLQLINISFDQDCGMAAQVAKAHGATWPQVCDGKGPLTDAALRYSIDGPPRLIVIGRDGKIAALHLYPFDDDTAKETAKLVEAALAEGANGRGATGR
jgi:thiol-disulfide isomerase/thioredoxin